MITITKLREYDDSFRASLNIEYTNRIESQVFKEVAYD